MSGVGGYRLEWLTSSSASLLGPQQPPKEHTHENALPSCAAQRGVLGERTKVLYYRASPTWSQQVAFREETISFPRIAVPCSAVHRLSAQQKSSCALR